MTLSEHVKIRDNKIKGNKAQYDLDREQLKYLHYKVVNYKNMNT